MSKNSKRITLELRTKNGKKMRLTYKQAEKLYWSLSSVFDYDCTKEVTRWTART